MSVSTLAERPMSKKKSAPGSLPQTESKKYGTMIRVSEAFAEALRQAAGFDQVSISEFADTKLLPIVVDHYRESVIKAARRMEQER